MRALAGRGTKATRDWRNRASGPGKAAAAEAPKAVPVAEVPKEEVKEEPKAEPAPVAEVPAEIEESAADEEDFGEDEWALTPEGKVRRAAWNKGLRCRRNYGPDGIQTAFVKSKVAVFVLESDARTELDDKLEAEGWTVLRYKEADITDGQDQAAEIKQAAKDNLRAMKKTKKRK